LDLSNNRIGRIAAGTFASQRQLRLLQLSGNPIRQLEAGSFQGLSSLGVLSLGYVSSDEVTVDHRVFDDVSRSLSRLELDSSPSLLRAVLRSDAALVALRQVAEISARSSDLVTVRDDLPSFLSASALRLFSSRWHCDRRLVWLRDWVRQSVATATGAPLGGLADENRCGSPRRLAGRYLFSLADDEFDSSTALPDGPATPPFHLPTVTTPAKSTTSTIQGRGSTSTDQQHQRGVMHSSRSPDRPSDEQEDSRYVFRGNKTVYHDVDLERKRPPYRRIHDVDPSVRLSTHTAPPQDFEYPVADRSDPDSFDQASTKDPLAVSGRRAGGTSTGVSTVIAVAVTIGVTCVIVVIILTVIIRLVRGGGHATQDQAPSADLDVVDAAYRKDAIRQRQRNGTLYFLPVSASTAAANGACLSAPTSRTRLDVTVPPSDGARSITTGEMTSLLRSANVGRTTTDNSTEPLRVYKWEDF